MMSIPEGAKSPAVSDAKLGPRTGGRPLLMMTITFLVVYFVSRAAAETMQGPPSLRVLVALAPAIPLLLLLVMFARAVRSMDELHVRVHLEALALAFPLTFLLLFVLGNLELVVTLNRDDWSYRHVWQMGSVLYFLGLAVAWRRYK